MAVTPIERFLRWYTHRQIPSPQLSPAAWYPPETALASPGYFPVSYPLASPAEIEKAWKRVHAHDLAKAHSGIAQAAAGLGVREQALLALDQLTREDSGMAEDKDAKAQAKAARAARANARAKEAGEKAKLRYQARKAADKHQDEQDKKRDGRK
jgi:hypothetical protein